jgi:formate dehydrogenase maturation protein FdhE
MELNEYLCPICGSVEIVCIMDDIGENGNRHENCGCKVCDSSWYNHYKLDDQEVIVRMGKRVDDMNTKLVIKLTNGSREACGDCEMVSRMMAGDSKEDLQREYEHEMPDFYFEE